MKFTVTESTNEMAGFPTFSKSHMQARNSKIGLGLVELFFRF